MAPDDATTYPTEADAQIAIKQLGIPYVTAVPLDQARDNWTVTVFWKDEGILKLNFVTLGGAQKFLTEIVEAPRLFNSVTIAQI